MGLPASAAAGAPEADGFGLVTTVDSDVTGATGAGARWGAAAFGALATTVVPETRLSGLMPCSMALAETIDWSTQDCGRGAKPVHF